MGMLELWRAPKLTVTSAKLIVYFSVLTSFHHPSANALAGHIFNSSSSKRFHGGWVSVIYLQGEGKENFLSLVSEGGISLLSPSLLLWGLKATPTVGLRSLGSKVDNDQKWGTQPSPNFTSSEILNITAHSP